MSDWNSNTMTDREIDREITRGDDDQDDDTQDAIEELLAERRVYRAQERERERVKQQAQLEAARGESRYRLARYIGATLMRVLAPRFEPHHEESEQVDAHFTVRGTVGGDTLTLYHTQFNYENQYSVTWKITGPRHFEHTLYAGELDEEAEARRDQILDAIAEYQDYHAAYLPAGEAEKSTTATAAERHCNSIWGEQSGMSGVLNSGARVRLTLDGGFAEGVSHFYSLCGVVEDRDKTWILLNQDNGEQSLIATRIVRMARPLPASGAN